MKHFIFPTFFTIAIVCVVAGCKKGNDGPAGPAGPAGATGATGATGTANVIYSAWFTPASYVKDTIFSIWGFNYYQAAPGITQQILDNGTVLTYGKLNGYSTSIWPANQVAQLPISLTYRLGTNNTDTWSALATVGQLHIRMVNDQNTYGSISVTHAFRYVIIPGGKAGARLAQMSYEEVCKQYHIPE